MVRIKYTDAKDLFEHALKNQQSISIPKLKQLMTDLNMTLESSESKEVRYLKNENKLLRNQLKRKGKKHGH